MAKNTFLDWSETASNNTDIGGVGILGTNAVSNFDDAFRTLMAQLRAGVDGEVVYVTKAGNYTAVANDNNAIIRFTAVATLSLTAAATLAANWHLTVIADGADVTIDPNGAETIDGAATLVVPNGFSALIVCSGTAFYTNKFVSLVQNKATMSFGECRVTLSGGNLLLSRFNGQLLTINGLHYSIPSAGVTLAATSLTPSTLYYIYAYMNSGTMTLEASATANATDTVTGMQIKTGDATRTLVGMARPITGPAWADSNQQRFVRSWFNDQGVTLSGVLAASTDAASTSPSKLSTNLDIEALLWSGEVFDVTSSGAVFNNTADAGNISTIAFDGTGETAGAISLTTAISQNLPFSVSAIKTGLAQGYHLATLFASTNIVSTGRWRGDADGRRTNIVGRVHR
ncbi:hypothetical protein [Rhizobium ecuadorense]|uniref:hypothetical protein n=1 Tax=Rhizobium ecuadorense TaxID=1671795 RepID=UPI0006737A47|nr:hypothetical protein [Rhizobium ecuadorense]